MLRNKKTLVLVLVISLVVGIFSFGYAEEKYEIRVATTNQSGHPITRSLIYFGELLEKYAPGKFEVQVFSDSQLGGEREIVEGVQIGTISMGFSSTGPVGAFSPKLEVVNLPYLFRNNEHAYKVLDGEIGEELVKGFLDKGIRCLAFWENGWRQLTNSKRPINKPEDLKGLKIRVMESPIMVATLNAMGASAVPMGWPEVITSLQQGIIDGQENPIINNVYNGAYEVQKYLSLTRHFYNPSVLLINEKFYQKLPSDLQEVISKAAKEARDYQRDLTHQEEEKALKEVSKKFGLQVNYEPDIEAFIKSVEPVYKEFAEKLGGWDVINKIKNTK